MSFQNLPALLFLLFIPLYIILRKAGILKKKTVKTVLSDWNGKTFEWNSPLTKVLYFISKAFIYAAFILTVIALSDPVKKHQEKIYTSRGTDIMFAVDTSPSMVAKDMSGKTRLQVSLETIKNLAVQNNGTRYGLVTFGSEAAVAVPPTNDIDTFSARIQMITAGSMGDGSAIGTGISTAVYHLISSKAPKRCIILFTDGENNAGDIHPETAAELAAKHDITLYVFGVGSKGTVSIDYTDPVSGKKYTGYLDSDFDSSSLIRLAATGKGKYYETATAEQLSAALENISHIENLSQDFIYKTILDSLYKKILLAALGCLILAWFLTRVVLKNRRINLLKTIPAGLAFILFLLSLTDLSQGKKMVPVYKSSNAVAMVFDISNSMTAKDEEGHLSRLEAASVFAKKLLSRMSNTPVSIILSKGDGITAIPLTEDFEMTVSLIDSLSPALMTAPGTSLGKGISAAATTFPGNISSSNHIWVFTDGEETDSHLTGALSESIKKGISVKILGFGTESGTDIKIGNESVHTALQTESILASMNNAEKKMPKGSSYKKPELYKASDKGTGTILLSSLNRTSENESFLTYEEKPVNQFHFFLIPAIILFMLSIALSEIHFPKKHSKILAATILLCPFIFTGCQKSNNSRCIDQTFKGTVFYKQNEMEKAAGEFLGTLETASLKQNEIFMDYARYNLSTAYLLANEDNAALSRLNQISDEAADNIKFAAFFNKGVIYYKQGNKEAAAECFKKALLINSSSMEAKINLELCSNKNETPVSESESQLKPSSDSTASKFDEMEETIFERIKENDKKQWKNSESVQSSDSSKDY